ncbi:MAG: TonB-dependent receptor plug domain-containing protein [Flavobacteriales bacterium]
MKKHTLFSILLIQTLSILSSQQAVLKGIVIDDIQRPLQNVEIRINNKTDYKTDSHGTFSIPIPAHEDIQVDVFLEDYLPFHTTINANNQKYYTLNILLQDDLSTRLEEIVFYKKKQDQPIGSFQITTKNLDKLPSSTGSIEEILKTNPMVNSNTELSSQYMVRGGNYDENLVYINGIQLYRPQLIRSGQQEGLSFLNPSMVEVINFSAGGFEAKYGDKMSSVLDIIYKQPKTFEGEFEASLLGGSLTLGSGTKDGKLSAIIGTRYNDKRLLVDTQDSDIDFQPIYFDVQSNITYRLNEKLKFNFLGSFSQNDLDLYPKSRETTFGTLTNPYKLTVDYTGQENDLFQTSSGAISTIFEPNKRLTLTTDLSVYHSKEKEYFDINSRYVLGELNPATGAYISTLDTAEQIDHARNDLDLLVTSFQHRGKYKIKNGDIEWGFKLQNEDIQDRLNEYHRIDSAGFIRPTTGLSGFDYLFNVTNINTQNKLNSNRISGYIQYSKKHRLSRGKLMYNLGMRTTHWDYNKETNFSPRGQIAYKPDWKSDMLFRFSTGLYYQPPFYKEVRDVYGNLNPDIQSQRSIHFIVGNDYEFKLEKRPFKLTTEVYYKALSNIIPYYIDNVRIVYMGENNTSGNQYGIDMRLNGEFVPGNESFISLSYARARWNINHQGSIPMPTDQRLKIGLFYQDYMPAFPSFKVYLNAVYASGLPNGAPLYTNPYPYTGTLRDYKRLDIGFTKTFIDQNKMKPKKGSFWSNFRELSLGLEIFNLFDIENHISNLWVQDLTNSRYHTIPNRLTGRFFNAKMWLKF